MRITAIQTTRRGRFALFGEEGFLFSLDSETFFARHIQEGDCFSPGELAELRAASDTRKACDKALRCLSVRLWAAGELYQRLCRDFDEHSAAAAVAKMQQLELLDDASFARQKAAWMARRNKSPREIRMQLARCGVDEAITEAVMEELFAQNEEELSPARQAILYGTGKEKLHIEYKKEFGSGTFDSPFEGICNNLERRYRETQSDGMKQEYEAESANYGES